MQYLFYKTPFPLADANGNCVTYIDNAGNIQAHCTYDAFGGMVSSDGDMDDYFRFRFSSKYLDDETGLYYYGYRYYSPILGRWVNRDPIKEEGGLLLYGFGRNNGVDQFDALGLSLGDPTMAQYAITSGYLEGQLAAAPEGEGTWGGSVSFLFSTHEFLNDDGCIYYCYSFTPTELAGIGMNMSAGVQKTPVSVSYGFSKHLSLGSSPSIRTAPVGPIRIPTGVNLDTFDASVGIGLTWSPVHVSIRAFCFSFTEYDNDGCPCSEKTPKSIAGYFGS